MSYQQLRRQQQKISPLESDFPSSKIFGRSLVVLLHRPVTLPSLPLFLPPSPLLLFDIIILTVCGNMKKKKGGKSVGGGGGEERSRLGPKTYQVLWRRKEEEEEKVGLGAPLPPFFKKPKSPPFSFFPRWRL